MEIPLIPLEHFYDDPERAAARVSPDGRRLAWLAPAGDGPLNVWVSPIEGGEPVQVTNDRDRGVRSYSWSRDGARVLYMQDTGGDENYHLFAADLDNPDAPDVDLTPFDGVKVGVVDVPRGDPDHVLVSTNRRDRGLFDVERLNLTTGAIDSVAENPGNIMGWLTDREGRLRGAFAQTPTGDHQVLVRDAEDQPFRVLADYANEDSGSPYAFTKDGREIYVGSARESDLVRLVALDTATGQERLIDQDEQADLGAPIISDRTGELLGAAYRRDRIVLHTFDETFARDWERVRQIHPGDPMIGSTDDDETLWTVAFDDDRDPGATYLFDRRTGESRLLFRSRPWLDPMILAERTPVKITSRDGLTLPSYLTLPVGADPTNLPAVIYVHGGPWARDSWGWEPTAQFLANRGYAVLQVNYRGSTGFGKAFTHAAEKEFAGKMHDDLIDGVNWLIGEDIADPKRIAIYGGSYGGYAALVGASFTPDVFAAAISVVGPSNLVTLVRSFPPYWRPLLAGTWFKFVGDPEDPEERKDLEARSPINRVDQITAPLLVLQGANDPRVVKAESDQIVEALRARGVPVEYIVKDDEGHGFVKPENKLDIYRAVEKFLARHLGGRFAPSTVG
jgi:dipeptidyl aminopeptidase/acylaminoacyl peptidase